MAVTRDARRAWPGILGGGVWTPKVRGWSGQLRTTAGRHDVSVRFPGRRDGASCFLGRRAVRQGVGRGFWALKLRGSRAGLGRLRDSATRQRAPPRVMTAVPARRDGTTTTSPLWDAGRARMGRRKRGLGAQGPGTAGSASRRPSPLVSRVRRQQQRRETPIESVTDAPKIRQGRADWWGQLGGPSWSQDGWARARGHRGGPSGLLGQRDDKRGIAGGRGRRVDASAGGGQYASWSAMAKMGGWWITEGVEARTLNGLSKDNGVFFARLLTTVCVRKQKRKDEMNRPHFGQPGLGKYTDSVLACI